MRTKAQKEAVAAIAFGLLCLLPALWTVWVFVDLTITHALAAYSGNGSTHEEDLGIVKLGAISIIITGCFAALCAIIVTTGLSSLRRHANESWPPSEDDFKRLSRVIVPCTAVTIGCMASVSVIRYAGIQDVYTAWMVGIWPVLIVSAPAFLALITFWMPALALARQAVRSTTA